MVIIPKRFWKMDRVGALTTDLVIALAILTSTMIPLSFSFLREQKLLRHNYERAAAMEIVDGEMEILSAGEWKEFPEGTHPYTTPASAFKNLPVGDFTFTKRGDQLRLEWKSKSVKVSREGKGR